MSDTEMKKYLLLKDLDMKKYELLTDLRSIPAGTIVEYDATAKTWSADASVFSMHPAMADPDLFPEWFKELKPHKEKAMSEMKEYTVQVWPNDEYNDGRANWYLNGKLHREDGPAVERADGYKSWYLNGKRLTEAEFNARRSLIGKKATVEIDGKRYRITIEGEGDEFF